MKRMWTMVLSVAFAFSLMVSLAGCGGVNYGGKFTEVTDEAKLEQVMTDINTAKEKADKWTGIKMTLDFKLSVTGKNYLTGEDINENFKMKGTMYAVYSEDDMQMLYELSGKSGSEKMTMKLYIKEGCCYIYMKDADINVKGKVSIEDMDILDDLMELMDISDVDPDSLLSDLGDLISDDNVKVSVTAESGKRNIKISGVSEDTSDMMTFIIALDADNNVLGIKMDMKMSMDMMGTQTSIEGTFSIENYSQAIKFPNLNSYSELSEDEINELMGAKS